MHCSALSDSSPVVSLEKGEKREGSRETTGDESAALWLAVKILRHFPRQWDLNRLKLIYHDLQACFPALEQTAAYICFEIWLVSSFQWLHLLFQSNFV